MGQICKPVGSSLSMNRPPRSNTGLLHPELPQFWCWGQGTVGRLPKDLSEIPTPSDSIRGLLIAYLLGGQQQPLKGALDHPK